MKAIEVLGIGKSYGKRPALSDVSFEVDPGDAVAVVGPNGAGKTTLLRILATLIKPTAGYAKVMDLDGRFQAARIRRVLSYMPDVMPMERDLTVGEYLEFFAGLHGLRNEARTACVRDLVALLDLGEVRDRATDALSRGMQQRVGLARTLIHNPSVLLLDEPAANLDPKARIEIREVLKALRGMGKTILISSHILSELGPLCNKIALVDKGRLIRFGSIAALAAETGLRRRIELKVAADAATMASSLGREAAVESVELKDGRLLATLREGAGDPSFVAAWAVREQAGLLSLREEEADLEAIFLRLTGPKGGA